MIQRYLGNKSSLLAEIIDTISELADPGELVFDAFSGTLAVSLALKAAGYHVACNDINFFSWVYAQAYLANSELPRPETGVRTEVALTDDPWPQLLSELTAPYSGDPPDHERRTDVFDHYCEAGPKSAYLSKRGQSGRRRFFSSENAVVIDRALSRIRWWYRTGLMGESTRCILTASLLNAVERVSNTQGTYHDFPREFYDPRALKPIKLLAPQESSFKGPATTVFGMAEDSLEFVEKVPPHQVLYLDPPYNFRQYTSYYFILNLFAKYPEIDNLDEYFKNIEYVRGQNMEDDFSSTFCSKKTFISSLQRLIQNAKTRFVVLSYFDGRNHWGSFKSAPDKNGRTTLEHFFQSPLFVSNSMRCVPVKRLNYQSYGGYKARPVQEYLFVAEKWYLSQPARCSRDGSWIGKARA